jgi:hypothetical protein
MPAFTLTKNVSKTSNPKLRNDKSSKYLPIFQIYTIQIKVKYDVKYLLIIIAK